ncbi:MAG: CDP-alcohol phosphatidyltransferase family protein, partial [Gemmatimonas sp.]
MASSILSRPFPSWCSKHWRSPTAVNLPNAITMGRIALTPLIAWLPFTTSWSARLGAFVLFLVAAVTDYWDGHLARSRNLV